MKKRRKTRIAYLSGPVDAVDVYERWENNQQLGYFGNSQMSEFYQVCSNLGFEGYVITTLPGALFREQKGSFLIENCPAPTKLRGILYHLGQVLWLITLLPRVLRFKPDIFIVTAARHYWFVLTILKWRNIVVVPVLAGTLWPKFAPTRMSLRFLLLLNKFFFVQCARAVMVASEDIAVQVRSLMREKPIPIVTFLPTYRRSQFSLFHPANPRARPFKVFFAGRIETNKGIYDMVAIAQWLEQRHPNVFHFDICGEGSELESLRRRIEHLGLTPVMTCHGFCDRSKLSILLDHSCVVIVPTTTAFEEGFNMVCAEAILAGRPLVTSAVCPALAYVRDAAIEVTPDNVEEYCQAILKLAHDKDLYERKRLACKLAQEQFYDFRNSWSVKLTEVLANHFPPAFGKVEPNDNLLDGTFFSIVALPITITPLAHRYRWSRAVPPHHCSHMPRLL
jgi:glycogen(starch) synthase